MGNININQYCSAVTCDAPTIADGANNCGGATVAWDGSCGATCNAGFYGPDATITCNVDNSGTGGFDETLTCTGKVLLYLNN